MEFSVRKVLEAAGRLRDFSESFPEVDPSVRLGCENSNNLVFQLAAAAHSVHDELLLHETMPLNLPSTSAAPDLKEFGFIGNTFVIVAHSHCHVIFFHSFHYGKAPVI